MGIIKINIFLFFLSIFLFPPYLFAASNLPAGFVEDAPIFTLNEPTAFDWSSDGKLFILEKAGTVTILSKSNSVLNRSALQLSVTFNSERGLLGVALDPQVSVNGFIYLYYTTASASLNYGGSPKNRVSRFRINGNLIERNSELILVDNIPSDQGNHNGGGLMFSSDGSLFISTGDGGNQNNRWSQKLDSLGGKILRINPQNGNGAASNPFISSTNQITQKVWAYGLRNPYRFSINSANGRIVIADVGAGRYEEIDNGNPGANYGWPDVEGPSPAGVSGMTYPIFYYGRSGNQNSSFNNCAAIIGGGFKKGANFPATYDNTVIFGDYTCGKLWAINPDNVNSGNPFLFASDVGGPVNIAFGPDGMLYWADIYSGQIRRIRNTTTQTHCLPLGDTNCSGKVDSLDLSYLLSKLGSDDAKANLDNTGGVNALDLSILLGNLG